MAGTPRLPKTSTHWLYGKPVSLTMVNPDCSGNTKCGIAEHYEHGSLPLVGNGRRPPTRLHPLVAARGCSYGTCATDSVSMA